MNNCHICSDLMLRHIRQNKIYWFCSSCYQEIPNFTPFEDREVLQSRAVSSLIGKCKITATNNHY